MWMIVAAAVHRLPGCSWWDFIVAAFKALPRLRLYFWSFTSICTSTNSEVLDQTSVEESRGLIENEGGQDTCDEGNTAVEQFTRGKKVSWVTGLFQIHSWNILSSVILPSAPVNNVEINFQSRLSSWSDINFSFSHQERMKFRLFLKKSHN